jgi:hypothetical protein
MSGSRQQEACHGALARTSHRSRHILARPSHGSASQAIDRVLADDELVDAAQDIYSEGLHVHLAYPMQCAARTTKSESISVTEQVLTCSCGCPELGA